MNRMLTIALSLIAGLTGGLLTRYIAPQIAFAQAPVTKEIRAQSFTLVDEMDRVIGTFAIDYGRQGSPRTPFPPVRDPRLGNQQALSTPRRIVLWDVNGREIWSAGGLAQLLNESLR